MNAIWSGVYGGFAGLDPQDWPALHEGAMRRIELVAGYYNQHPEQWAPMPYAERIPGRGYFDRENKKGFGVTYAWLLADAKRREKNKIEQALLVAGREMKQCHDLEKGLITRVSKFVQNKTLRQLHTYHRKRLHQLGGEQALYRFAQKLTVLKIIPISN